jgi:hypothetical protein
MAMQLCTTAYLIAKAVRPPDNPDTRENLLYFKVFSVKPLRLREAWPWATVSLWWILIFLQPEAAATASVTRQICRKLTKINRLRRGVAILERFASRELSCCVRNFPNSFAPPAACRR